MSKPIGWQDTFEVWERHAVLGGRLHLDPNAVERDRRKQKKAMRALVEAGYAAETPEGTWEATGKAWDETEPAPPDLFAHWQDSRGTWNTHSAPLVPYDRLPRDSRKAVATDPAVKWWLAHENVTQYRRRVDEREDYLYGPFSLAGAVEKKKDLCAGHLWAKLSLCVSTAEMEAKVEETLAAEAFDHAFRTNLPWGLWKVLEIPKGDAELLKSSDMPGFVLGGSSNFGVVPEEWGEKVVGLIDETRGRIGRLELRLAVLNAVRGKVDWMGGWGVFRERMAAALREKMAEPDKEGEGE